MKNKVEILVLVAVCALGTSLMKTQSSPSVAEPVPSKSPSSVSPAEVALTESRLITLGPEQSASVARKGGSRFFLKARIEFEQAAGAAYLLEVKADGQPVGSLINKGPAFQYKDSRSFDYRNPEGIWNVFYSPDFRSNCDDSGGGYQLLGKQADQAYRYGWILPSRPNGAKVKVQLRHVGMHEGQTVSRNLILELE